MTAELQFMGSNLIDLYFGALGVEEICRQCVNLVNDGVARWHEAIITMNSFEQWLSPYAYRKVALSDGSWWIIKAGNDPERFIHIHPAKYSPATVRIRAATLKTLVAMKIFMRDTRDPQCKWAMELTDMVFRVTKAASDCLQLGEVNRVRVHLLGLSPIKAIEWGRGIARLWPLFQNG